MKKEKAANGRTVSHKYCVFKVLGLIISMPEDKSSFNKAVQRGVGKLSSILENEKIGYASKEGIYRILNSAVNIKDGNKYFIGIDISSIEKELEDFNEEETIDKIKDGIIDEMKSNGLLTEGYYKYKD